MFYLVELRVPNSVGKQIRFNGYATSRKKYNHDLAIYQALYQAALRAIAYKNTKKGIISKYVLTPVDMLKQTPHIGSFENEEIWCDDEHVRICKCKLLYRKRNFS